MPGAPISRLALSLAFLFSLPRGHWSLITVLCGSWVSLGFCGTGILALGVQLSGCPRFDFLPGSWVSLSCVGPAWRLPQPGRGGGPHSCLCSWISHARSSRFPSSGGRTFRSDIRGDSKNEISQIFLFPTRLPAAASAEEGHSPLLFSALVSKLVRGAASRKGEVKNRTLTNHKDAAPRVIPPMICWPPARLCPEPCPLLLILIGISL